MRERTLMWEKNIGMISETAEKYTRGSYTTVTRAVRLEWIFLQRVTWDTGGAFVGVERLIRESFLPHLFVRKTKSLLPIVGAISTM